MKLYIINKGLWHFCPGRAKIDSLFYKKESYLYCPMCETRIPDWVAYPFLEHTTPKYDHYITLAKEGNVKDYELQDLKSLKYQEIEIDEDLLV